MIPLRLGVIGLGKMGLSHLAIANAMEFFDVAAVSDLSKLVGKSIAQFTGSRYYRNYRDLLELSNVDAVIISVPTHLHFQIALEALNERKHVFLEKPLTLSPERSTELVEKAKDSRVATQVGYVNRASPIFDHLRRMLANREFGEPKAYECAMRGNVLASEGAQGWRNDHRWGGGCLYEYGSHCIDLDMFLFGPVERLISAKLENRYSSNVEDVVTAHVTHTSGLRGTLVIDWADSRFRKASNMLTVLTEQALIFADKQEIRVHIDPPHTLTEAMSWSVDRQPSKRVNATDLDTQVPYYLRGEDFTRQLIEFRRLVDGNASLPVAQFADGLATDQLISEIFERGERP